MTAPAVAVDQALERLIDAGYSDAWVELIDGQLFFDHQVPLYVVWRICAVCGLTDWCWPCVHAHGPVDLAPDQDHPTWPNTDCTHPCDPACPEERTT